MQQTPLMTFQPQMDLSQNMMGSTMPQPAMIQPMINPNNEIDPSKFFI
jgi:isopentenyl diphosphate isomerase/L-lactate dehydrogenase-like FMN-dependent dehydrogenase